MATEKDLQHLVKYYNKKYCKKTKNHLVIRIYPDDLMTPDELKKLRFIHKQYRIGLKGKINKRTGKPLKGSIVKDFGFVGANNCYLSPTQAIVDLKKADAHGWLESQIKKYENRK